MVRKGFCFWLDEEIVNRFKNFVLAKCGYNLHAYGNEVERAMEHYMRNPSSANTHTFAHDVLSMKVTNRLEKVFLTLKYNCPFDGPTDDDLYEAIGEVAGRDDRTFWKYRRLLLANGYLKIQRHEWRPMLSGNGIKSKSKRFFIYDWGPKAELVKEAEK